LTRDIDRWRRRDEWWEFFQLYPLRPRAILAFEQREVLGARAGVDMRHPFADRDLVEFLLSLPCAIKSDPISPKALLRDSLADVIPPIVRDRTKSDSAPIAGRRVRFADCLERISTSNVRLPNVDYDRLSRDGATDPD